jgi:hypothetical protein
MNCIKNTVFWYSYIYKHVQVFKDLNTCFLFPEGRPSELLQIINYYMQDDVTSLINRN